MRIIIDKTKVSTTVEELIVARKSTSIKYRIIINVVASIIIMCCAGSVYAWSIFVGPLKTEYGFSTAQTQLIFGCIIGVFSVTMLYVSRIERKIGPRYSAAIGAALFSAGYLLASFSGGNTVIILLGIGVLSGAGMGFGYVTVLCNLVKWFPGHKGLATGIAVAGFGSGAILLSQIAQPILDTGTTVTYVFRYTGIFYGVIFLAGALAISAPVNRKPSRVEIPVSLKFLSRDKRFWVLFFTFFAGSFAGLVLIGNLKNIGIPCGVSSRAALLAIVFLSVGNAAGRIIWGYIYDKIGGKRAISIALSLASFFILMLLVRFLGDIFFLTLCLLFGICYGANFVLYASDVSHIYGIEQLGFIYPVVSVAYGISGIVGPFVGGYVFDITQSYFTPIVLSAIICFSGLAVYVIFMSRTSFPNR